MEMEMEKEKEMEEERMDMIIDNKVSTTERSRKGATLVRAVTDITEILKKQESITTLNSFDEVLHCRVCASILLTNLVQLLLGTGFGKGMRFKINCIIGRIIN